MYAPSVCLACQSSRDEFEVPTTKSSAASLVRPVRPKVLIVEDEPLAACFLQELFTIRFGCEADIAPSGLVAIERLAEAKYALIVSDVRLPEINGTELYLWMSEAQPEMARRFVFVTAYADEKYFGADLVLWGVPILAKPYTIPQLSALCGPYLERPREA
jgi:two-component system NtrC family sensor kinase